jgi:hypothetical protein
MTLYMMNNYEPAHVVGTAYHKLNKERNTGNSGGDWDLKAGTIA